MTDAAKQEQPKQEPQPQPQPEAVGLEGDDVFEEFALDDAAANKPATATTAAEDAEAAQELWQADWDDEETQGEDFDAKLKRELAQHAMAD